MMSDELQGALAELSQGIAPDMPRNSSAEEVAEMCLDASRLTMWGYPEQDKEVADLIQEHGYSTVLKEAARHVYTW